MTPEGKIRLAIRGFKNCVPQFEEFADIGLGGLETLLPSLARRHAAAMVDRTLDMIEIEFLDDPDPQQRFFRIGTNADGMVLPLRVKLK